MSNLINQSLRKNIRKKGIPVALTALGARMRCRMLYWKHGIPHWVFAEEYGFVILNLTTVQGLNVARKKHKISRLRLRDMDRICIFRYPRKGWLIKKSNQKKK